MEVGDQGAVVVVGVGLLGHQLDPLREMGHHLAAPALRQLPASRAVCRMSATTLGVWRAPAVTPMPKRPSSVAHLANDRPRP